MINIGGAKPEQTSMSTFGHPGRYTYCIGEHEEASPGSPTMSSTGWMSGPVPSRSLPGRRRTGSGPVEQPARPTSGATSMSGCAVPTESCCPTRSTARAPTYGADSQVPVTGGNSRRRRRRDGGPSFDGCARLAGDEERLSPGHPGRRNRLTSPKRACKNHAAFWFKTDAPVTIVKEPRRARPNSRGVSFCPARGKPRPDGGSTRG